MRCAFAIVMGFALMLASAPARALQDENAARRWDYGGYIKSLQMVGVVHDHDTVSMTTLLHHRLNAGLDVGTSLKLSLGLRNRVFVGDQVRPIGIIRPQMERDAGLMDLSFVPLSGPAFAWVLNIDRLNIAWSAGGASMRLGRQRINWGMNLVWNPNDLFNTYNFLDFDYEERPGVDAVLLGYTMAKGAEWNLAVAPSRADSTWRAAVRYSFNTQEYDIQLIAGLYEREAVGGIGWAGNIGDAGWKGEATVFQRLHGSADVSTNASGNASTNASISTGIDYMLAGGWYVSGSVLYTSAAGDRFGSIADLTRLNLSPKMLMPLRWNLLCTASKSFSPLLSGSVSLVYAPRMNLLIVLPTFSYSIANDWTADVVMQSFFSEEDSSPFHVLAHGINLRVRWSY